MAAKQNNKLILFGQDLDVLVAAFANILSWFVSTFVPSLLPHLLPSSPEEEQPEQLGQSAIDDTDRTKCISIGRPGGLEQLRLVTLRKGIVTIGYNVRHVGPPPYAPPNFKVPSDCALIRNEAFSVNYADCCIRWGLYDSAKEFVGWPIVPGFDVAGVVEEVGGDNAQTFSVGDRVFGCTLFGAYSNRVIVPNIQLRKMPDSLSFAQAAAFPAVSLTALYALHLAGYFPNSNCDGGRSKFQNKSILIHSAAGGVGGFLVQMSKILGLGPIVGVVGSTSKVEEAKALGCDVVIDKSTQNLWSVAEAASPKGYSTIMDANGVTTLQQSYDHLAPSGRLVVFGFHSNLPMGSAMLSPLEWFRMAKKVVNMPRFDSMDLTVSNKAVLGFNLSFFADEREVLSDMFDQVLRWIQDDKLSCPRIVEMNMEDVAGAHELIQSGKSIGKIILRTTPEQNQR
jgi:NADPH:quinone reductase-like Zn-dependent oxidoreductase